MPLPETPDPLVSLESESAAGDGEDTPDKDQSFLDSIDVVGGTPSTPSVSSHFPFLLINTIYSTTLKYVNLI